MSDPTHSDAADSSSRLVLMFQSGTRQGETLLLDENVEIIVGRGKSAGVVIDDSKASRQHAKLSRSGEELHVEDLGSINGTFVNGTRITERTLLFPGDSVEIANVRFKVELKAGETGESAGAGEGPGSSSVATMGNILSDSLETTSLKDMLGFLTSRQKTGVLLVRTSWGTGRIHLREGVVYHAAIDRLPGIRPAKAIQRLLRARSGSLEFSIEAAIGVGEELGVSIEEIEREDEAFPEAFERLETMIPAPDARIIVGEAAASENAEEKEILDLAREHGTLTQVMDLFSGPDSRALNLLADLAGRGAVSFTR